MNISLMSIIVRWVHIISACLALGVPMFVRYFLTPAAEQVLDGETHQRLKATINNTWRIMVYLLITLFLLSGLYTFVFVVLRMDLGPAKQVYHGIFGVKLLLAFVAFFLASALAGKSESLAVIRKNAKFFQTILILCLLVIIMLGGALRGIRDQVLVDRAGGIVVPALAPASTNP